MKKFRQYCLKLSIFLMTFFTGQFLFADDGSKVHPIMEFFGLGNSPLTTIAPANRLGREVNELYALTGWIGLLIFLILAVLFVIIVIRFRAKVNPKSTDSHGNFFLEMLWTVIPIIILIIIAVPTIRLIFLIGDIPDLTDKDKISIEYSDGTVEYDRYLELNVVGHQWWWEFEYIGFHERKKDSSAPSFRPIHRITANEPWLPINVPIKINLTSEDVIHSFWLPRIAGKTDAVPGHINELTFVIEEEGFYYGQCAEYCGASHALMRFHVNGVSEEKFNKWLDWGQGKPIAVNASAERGKVAIGTCMACHTMNGIRTFEPRKARIEAALAKYETDKAAYLENIKDWKEQLDESGELKGKWLRELNSMPSRPNIPVIPKLYQDTFRTIAPDLTDYRFRKKILAGIRDNTKENLTEWIKNPPSIKPEVYGTPVIRMPIYEHILTEQTINDLAEFLMTVEYSNSKNQLTFNN